MKFLISIVSSILFISITAHSQEPTPGSLEYSAEGRMLVLKVVPGDKSAKLFFFGKKSAELDFNKDHKLLSVTATSAGKTETLTFKKNPDSYEVLNLPQRYKPYELKVKSEVRGKIEDLKIQIPNH